MFVSLNSHSKLKSFLSQANKTWLYKIAFVIQNVKKYLSQKKILCYAWNIWSQNKKEYAAGFIDDLIKVDAVENIEAEDTELPWWLKDALDKELQAIAENLDYTIS